MIELPVITAQNQKRKSSHSHYWRSISQLKDHADLQTIEAEEFFPGASDGPGGSSRRQFLQIMGASMAMAGLSACRRPVENILPFSHKPEEMIPGVPMEYATSMPFRGSLVPLVVESSDGRPTKVEGRPDHPEYNGSSGVFEQASVLSLYDPDRSEFVLKNGKRSTWSAFQSVAADFGRDARIAVIEEPGSSLTRARLRAEFEKRFGNVQWVEYSSTGDDPFAKATLDVFGRELRQRIHFEDAKVIVALDADPLSPTDPAFLLNTAAFARGRSVAEGAEMSRLYTVESGYSITGGVSDNRLRMKSSEIPALAASIARRLGIDVAGGESYDEDAWVSAMVRDLRSARNEGVILAGENQPAEVHALCIAINDALGSPRTVVEYIDAGTDGARRLEGLRSVVESMKSGTLDAVVLLNVNPVYDAPSEIGFKEAFASQKNTIHLGLYADETAAGSTWHLPATHYLEAWGDGRSFGGYQAVIQPLIAPLYDEAHSSIELLDTIGKTSGASGYDLVRTTWKSIIPGDFESGWKKVLHDGIHPGKGYARVTSRVNRRALPGTIADAPEGLELVVRMDAKVLGGAFSNSAWLQELPESTTKVVWDNVALMSPATASNLGVAMDLRKGKYFVDRIALTSDAGTIDLPIWIQPGMADDSISVATGYGREISSNRSERHTSIFDLDDYTDIYGHGAISTAVGENVAPIRGAFGAHVVTGITAVVSGSDYLVASTQDHGALPEEGEEVKKRGLFRMATLEEYRANPRFVAEGEPEPIREEWKNYPTLWQEDHPTVKPEFQHNDYFQNQWGMVIDLNTCTGCNSCVVACQAENNIQVVGKEEVSRGREMHWIRLDRYFVSEGDGATEQPRMVLQPVPCMHCENAPCEEVCPVAATVHSPDGTNQMIYNRCIGTRYCANNCPYKVRRFNFFNWSKTIPQTVQMAQNPNVTVRSRGVMEKCSFCIQRIREVNKKTNIEKRPIRDGEIVVACQQACPAKAISFGDMNVAESTIMEQKSDPRRYDMLAELAVKPRTSYLGRIMNPNPDLGGEA